MDAIIFIYKKGDKYKVIDRNRSIENHNNLIKNHWTHTHTIDAAVYMQQLLNCKEPDAMESIRELKM